MFGTILETIESWQKGELRENRPFINFRFADPSILKVRVLALPSVELNRPEPIIDENISEEDVEACHKPYVQSGFDNIKRVLDILEINSESKIMISANIHNCHFLKFHNGVTDKLIKEKLENPMIREEKGLILGDCTYQNMLDIIFGKIAIEFCSIFEDHEEYQNTTVGPSLLIHFIDKQLGLYIYDVRGGILVSDTNDRKYMEEIYKKTEKTDTSLINFNWFKEMVMSILDWTEEEFEEKFRKEET